MDEIYDDIGRLYDDLARVRNAFDNDINKLHYRHLLEGSEISRAEVEANYAAISLRGRHIKLLEREIEQWPN